MRIGLRQLLSSPNSALFVLRFLKSQQKTRRKKEAVTAGCGLCSIVPSQFRDINVPQLSQILVWDIPVHLQTVSVGDTRQSLYLLTEVSARLSKRELLQPSRSLLLHGKVSTHLASTLPQLFSEQRRTRNHGDTSSRLEGPIFAIVSCRHICSSSSPYLPHTPSVHSLSSPPSQRLLLVLVSILLTHVSPIPCCVSFACRSLSSWIFLTHLPKRTTVQDGCRRSGSQPSAQVPGGGCSVQAPQTRLEDPPSLCDS